MKISKIILTIVTLNATSVFASQVSLRPGESQTFTSNTETTVTCEGGGHVQSSAPQVLTTYCECQNINSRDHLIMISVLSNNTKQTQDISSGPFGMNNCEDALKRIRGCSPGR
jgi:hypothetical protein